MKEEDIRKREVFNRYLQLVEEDAKRFFRAEDFRRAGCPACGHDDVVAEFEKLGFHYVTCKRCSTLFADPRPQFDSLKAFYAESPSTDFWVRDFFTPVAEVRREKIFRPRAEYIQKKIGVRPGEVCGDIGAGFGLFLEELRKAAPEGRYLAIEPSVKMAEICRRKSLEVLHLCLEEIQGMDSCFDLLTSFELLEHLHEPKAFLEKTYALLKPGGYLFATTLNGQGFDILLLGKKSKSLAPPQHLNFFNPGSMKLLLETIGFKVAEISTPGRLDWDIVEGMIKNEAVDAGKFWNYLADNRADLCKAQLQDWIAAHNLSSHMRILAQK